MSSLRADLVLDLGVIGERNIQIKYTYSEGCVDMVPHGNQSVAMNIKPSIHVESAIIVKGATVVDIIDFITDNDLRRLHNDIIEENHL